MPSYSPTTRRRNRANLAGAAAAAVDYDDAAAAEPADVDDECLCGG